MSRDRTGPVVPGPRARVTDRVEDAVAWLAVTLALATGLAGVAVGAAGYAHAMIRVRAETAGRVPAQAVLLEPASRPTGLAPADVARPMARWSTPAGRRIVGQIAVREQEPAGATMRIWLDRDGRAVPAPEREPVAVAVGSMWGALTAIGGWLLLALAWAAVRRVVAARNAAGWAREWRRVEPGWSGRSPLPPGPGA